MSRNLSGKDKSRRKKMKDRELNNIKKWQWKSRKIILDIMKQKFASSHCHFYHSGLKWQILLWDIDVVH
ncbi:hypothetical protein AALA98_17505 [Lachnospiraceae bacterium 45-W7]